ncbi:hypothetical protein [Kitasatospora sp. NPDC086791]|uniref:hypothetical protein n=1 Tax=Kitasatospora sp. NPDC086791 TaxID=3155178 RepID=UPI003425655D
MRRPLRHRPASLPERFDATVEQAPDQAVGQVPDQAPDQAPDQVQDQAPDQAPDQVQDQAPDQAPGQVQDQSIVAGPSAAGPGTPDPVDPGGLAAPEAVTAASDRPVAAAAIPSVLPARWQDASTTQLPLGVGLGMIGCGLGLIGLRLRKG